MSIYSLVPDPNIVLALEPEELAGVLIEYFNSLSPHDEKQINRYNLSLPSTLKDYPEQYRVQISQALMEAWIWLEREGLIAPRPGTQGEWFFITRRGQSLTKASDLKTYQKSNLLPRGMLHPVIAQKTWSAFLRGEYDTAVFLAFKEVEVSIRAVGGYTDQDYGIDLMRRAFHVANGPLTDQSSMNAEKQALSDLFAGAIGSYKNPHSHRNITITDPTEAAEIIIFASHLLRIVEARSPKR